jgi:hypothetical protein
VRLHQSGIAKHAIDARGADGNYVGIQHHEGEPPIALQGMTGVEVENGCLLPWFEPPVAGHERVVLVGQSVAGLPVVELARADAEPTDEALPGDFGTLGPVANEVDDGVASVVGNPGSGQSTPSSFF